MWSTLVSWMGWGGANPGELFQQFFLALIAIFVAMDIIAAVPVYLGITKTMEVPARQKVVDQSIGVAFLVAMVFIFTGKELFRYLGIELFDFKMAGGLVLLLVSLAELLGRKDAESRSHGDTGIVPLAVPLISGPAVLTTVVLQVGIIGYVLTLIALLLNYFIAWLTLRHCDSVTKWIGRDGTVILSKIASLLLAAIAVAMIRSGVIAAITESGLTSG